MPATNAAPRLYVTRYNATTPLQAYKTTVRLIGEAIRNGSQYQPIREYAAGIATTAGPKDYLGQVRALYDDFTKNRWRYVKEPGEIVPLSGRAIFQQVLGAFAPQGQRGFGDCDCATAALGSAFAAIGLPVEIVTTAPPGAEKLFTHVLPRVNVPRIGWIAADAVAFPQHGLGYFPPSARVAHWDLNGHLNRTEGRFLVPLALGDDDNETKKTKRGENMERTQYPDYGLSNYGLAGADGAEPLDYAVYGLKEFGAYSPIMGLYSNEQDALLFEVGDDEADAITGNGTRLVRSKMLEISPVDYRHFLATGAPRARAVALGDDGTIYQWQQAEGMGAGFFKRLFKRIGKGVKKFAGKIKGFAKKLVKMLPGGKYLVKIYDKIHKVAMKLIAPLTKFVGKYAAKLAPIAALIPGYGTAVAAALYSAGKIANIMRDSGIVTDPKTGKPKFTSGQQAHAFRLKLHAAAKEAHQTGLVQKQMAAAAARRGRPTGRTSPPIIRPTAAAAPVSPAYRAFLPVATVPAAYASRVMQPGTRAHTAFLRGLGAL